MGSFGLSQKCPLLDYVTQGDLPCDNCIVTVTCKQNMCCSSKIKEEEFFCYWYINIVEFKHDLRRYFLQSPRENFCELLRTYIMNIKDIVDIRAHGDAALPSHIFRK